MLRKALSRQWPIHQLRCSYHEVSFATYGEPLDVLEYHKMAVEDNAPPNDAVRVEMWEAPWNPADVNTVQGKYASPFSDKNPASEQLRKSQYFPGRVIAGSEGWGRITDIRGTANHLSVGDVVTVGLPGLGTLRSSLWVPSTSLIPIARGLELQTKVGANAASLSQLGGTAHRMLREFCCLQPGEVIIQNAGNSGVGLMVSQLASKLIGVHVISMVRRGTKSESEWEALVDHLTEIGGAAIVIAEEEVSDSDALKDCLLRVRKLSVSSKLPSLALNAVGGESASILLRCLDQGGTLVTYGGMSGQPVTIGTPQLIFKNIRLVGYWHSRWMVQNNIEDKQAMVDELVDAVLDKSIVCPPVNVIELSKFHEGIIANSNQSGIREKLVLSCREKQ